MNRYRFRVHEWDGDSFNVLLYAENSQQALFCMMVIYPDAPAVSMPQLIEGAEPLSRWDKFLNLFRRKP